MPKYPGMHVSFQIKHAPDAFAGLRWDAELSERGLRRLSFSREKMPAQQLCGSELSAVQKRLLEKIENVLSARLNGGRTGVELAWSDFDLEPAGPFHLRVWRALCSIPHGKTASYGEIAEQAGSPLAFRACGQACGANRIVLFIPCHRVVASSGIGGFGYGLDWKRKLLELEGINL